MHILLANTLEREISLEVQRFHEQDARRADEELAGSLDLPDSQKNRNPPFSEGNPSY